MKIKDTKIAMIGCGKLGQDCAEVMAQQYMVEGYDVEPRRPENFKMKGSIQEAVKDNTWLKKEISHINKWKDIFFKTFKSLNITTNKSYANFMLININNLKYNSRNIFLKLAKSGILLRKMDIYNIKNCLRVTIGNVKENKKFLSTLKKIINV